MTSDSPISTSTGQEGVKVGGRTATNVPTTPFPAPNRRKNLTFMKFFFGRGCNSCAIVLQQYESISGSKYTLRTYHSFFPGQGQGSRMTKRSNLYYLLSYLEYTCRATWGHHNSCLAVGFSPMTSFFFAPGTCMGEFGDALIRPVILLAVHGRLAVCPRAVASPFG